ncbi:MAG: hypothetical protein PGN07_06510, partial [Aeromicrobium erythreum]
MNASRTRRAGLLTASVLAVGALGALSPAQAADANPADPTITADTGDLVGVGSDTSQLALHYLAEGKSGAGAGYNAGSPSSRIVSFAADGLPAKIRPRPTADEITRPNGSTAGKGLLYGGSPNAAIDFARSSSTLNGAEQSAQLQQFPFAVDGLKLAVKASGSNAPATITPEQMVGIYKGEIKNWKEIGGGDGLIKPYIPQSGSGTRSFFVGQLKAANAGTDVPLGGNVKDTQEHSDTDLKDDPNAIAPFSTGRAKGLDTIKLEGGFSARRALYNVVRRDDATTKRFLDAFGSDGYLCSDAAKPLIQAAGFDQLARPAAGGVCGVATQSATTSFVTSDVVSTTTTLTASGRPNGEVRLAAEVDPITAEGSVDFYEGETKIGSGELGATGRATTVLTGVAAGSHSYTARFVPKDKEAFAGSTSAAAATVVADGKYTGATTVEAPSGAYGVQRTVTVTVAKGDVDGTGAVHFVYGDATEQSADLKNGEATFTVPATLDVGTYWGVASHDGDANFAASFRLVKFTVSKAATTTKVAVSPTKVKVKKTTKATVTVAITGSTLSANGKVTLKIGSTVVGTGTVTNGKATVTVAAQKTTG